MSRGCSRTSLGYYSEKYCCGQQYFSNIANLLTISLFALLEIAPKIFEFGNKYLYSDVEERKKDAEYKSIVAASFCAAWEATRVFPIGVRSLINYLLCDWIDSRVSRRREFIHPVPIVDRIVTRYRASSAATRARVRIHWQWALAKRSLHSSQLHSRPAQLVSPIDRLFLPKVLPSWRTHFAPQCMTRKQKISIPRQIDDRWILDVGDTSEMTVDRDWLQFRGEHARSNSTRWFASFIFSSKFSRSIAIDYCIVISLSLL